MKKNLSFDKKYFAFENNIFAYPTGKHRLRQTAYFSLIAGIPSAE